MQPHEDPLDVVVGAGSYWTTTNTEEAHPGVLTPLTWSVAGTGIERATRGSLAAIGVLTKAESAVPSRANDRAFAAFRGRFAARLDFFVDVGNRLPGTTGPKMAEQIFSFVPPDAKTVQDRSRYAAIAWRLPVTFACAPRRTRALRASTYAWWRAEVARTPGLDLLAARRQFAAAHNRFNAVGLADGIALLGVVQPLYQQLARLTDLAGVDPGPLMSGHGSHEESRLVAEIWATSRDRLDVDMLLLHHGFHGPRTGELGSRSWREDPHPLLATIERYREMPDSACPEEAAHRRTAERQRAESELLAAVPVRRRPPARLLLHLARTHLQLRGKSGRTQALDVMRSAARRAGELLAADGLVADPEDVFMLTSAELTGALPSDVVDLIAARRGRYELYRGQTLPRVWQGIPAPIARTQTPPARAHTLCGIGASPGVVEGRARVVSDPAVVEMEPGEILVAYTTDPSWSALMFVAGALVVDVGSALSHAAIVARELAIPCVMNTNVGTVIIHTGDLCRVNGSTGEVNILEAARRSVSRLRPRS
jgi:phosphohistidine swiveling domain-containing protein